MESPAPLTLQPKRWFSWDFAVHDADRHVADIDVSWWRERGTLVVDGSPYDVYRERLVSGDFILESRGGIVARATKQSAFKRAFDLSHDGRTYTLRARGPFRRGFLLESGSREIGSSAPAGLFARRALVRLPETLPMAVRVFAMWLTILMWKRDSDGGAVTSPP